jgi:hypothetical protein
MIKKTKPKKCKICGNKFNSYISRKQRFCSRKCYYKNMVQRNKEGAYKNCLVCNKKFYVPKKRAKTAKWCSKKCWGIRNPPKKKNCFFCKKEFFTRRGGAEQKFCSHKCYSKNKTGQKLGKEWSKKISQSLKGKVPKNHWQKDKKHPNWKGGVTSKNTIARKIRQYKEWQKAVFERDNYTCQNCFVRSGNGKRIILNAHHVKGFAEFQQLRYDLDNGITFCLNCHDLIHEGRLLGHEKQTSLNADKIKTIRPQSKV